MNIKTLFFTFILQSAVFSQNTHKLVVGATPVPHAEILNAAKPLLLKSGINLTVKVFTDYVTPNIALADGSLDANYFQHNPYLHDFNNNKDTKLISAGSIHFEPLGVYSRKIKSLEELKDGDKIAIPSDVTNEARALMLLEKAGLITLKIQFNLRATTKDIKSNLHDVKIVEIEAAQLTRTLPGISAAVINGNYAIDAGLNPRTDALLSEADTSVAALTYANIVAIRQNDSSNTDIKKLIAVLQSEEIRKFILERYKGAVVPLQ